MKVVISTRLYFTEVDQRIEFSLFDGIEDDIRLTRLDSDQVEPAFLRQPI